MIAPTLAFTRWSAPARHRPGPGLIARWIMAALICMLQSAGLWAQSDQRAASAPAAAPSAPERLTVGSKRFTESFVLGEIIAEAARRGGASVEHRPGLGNTAIVYGALRAGSIDLYVEYTGTIAREILQLEGNVPNEVLQRRLAELGLAVSSPLGFNNTYALAARADAADRLGLRALSDLAGHAHLRMGFSPEFLARADGWAGLKRAYSLPHATPSGLDHGLAYEALAAGRVDIVDVYSTDAKIRRYALRVLADDRAFFPRYDAVLLYRADLPARAPRAWREVAALPGAIDAPKMIALNALVELDGRSFTEAAKSYFGDAAGGRTGNRDVAGGDASGRGDADAGTGSALRTRSYWSALWAADLWRLTREHLVLTFASLALAVLVGVPIGVVAVRLPVLGQWLLALVGIVQTIPSIALLALLIAAMGMIGFWPALVALALYALLPIVRNTYAGLGAVRGGLRQAAMALGLRDGARLRHVELPLALPTILAGVKTSAVINVGTATIAAFVGAGGLGERIVQGLAVNDGALLVAGALPAAALAILVQWLFELAERRTAPWLQVR